VSGSRLFLATLAGLALLASSPALAAPQLRAQVRGELPAELRTRIETAIGASDRPVKNRFDARQRANAAADEASAVLRSEGYYGSRVTPGVSEESDGRAYITIVAGPQFRIAEPRIEWIEPEPAAELQALGRGELRLEPGQAGRAIDVVSAEARILSAIQKEGYADAFIGPREVIVDHADQTLRPTYRISAGSLVKLAALKVETTGRTRPDWLAALAPWSSGDLYTPGAVLDLEKRLVEAGVYDQVSVSLAPPEEAGSDGLRPVVVTLTDRKPHRLEAGASYASSEGLGADMRWSHFNRFGYADTSAVFGRASTIDSRLGVEITLPHWRHLRQSLTGYAAVFNRQTSAYDETGLELRADVERKRSDVAFLTAGAALEYTQTRERAAQPLVSVIERDQLIGSLLGALALDYTDDVLNPRTGWRVDVRGEPTVLTGGVTLSYFKASAQGSAYLPLDADRRTVIAGRVKAGSILGGTISGVPASRRFYAGGGGSVRGYVYQGIGPHLQDNTPRGGLSLVEVSGEVRHSLTPQWGIVAFVDAGAVGLSAEPDFADLAVGVGLGVRYDLGFGPIRFDLAFPLDRRSDDPGYQIYVSIGQSF
jgi:translocation and assembly module TamA